MVYTRPFIRLWILVGLVAIPPLFLHALASTVGAQPEISESDPEDGAVLDAPPEIIHVCFSEPVESGGYEDFDIAVIAPEDQHLGLRILFDDEGGCADIYPGSPEGEMAGRWTVQWQVTSRATGETGSGSFQFSVSPQATPTPTPAPTPTPGAQGPAGEDNGDVDILLLALIVIGVGAGAIVLGLVYLRLRRKRFRSRR